MYSITFERFTLTPAYFTIGIFFDTCDLCNSLSASFNLSSENINIFEA